MDTQTASVIDPHSHKPQKLDKGKAKAVDGGDWASGWGNDGWCTSTAVVVASQDTAPTGNGKGKERRDSGWSSNNWVSSTAPHATHSPPAPTTQETTNAAWVNFVQETPQPNQSTTEKSANKGWGSWGANDGWRTPIPVSGPADGWSALPTPTGGNEGWGPPAPRLPTAGDNAVTTMTAAPTSAWGGTSGWNLKTTRHGKSENTNEGSFERGRGRGRGGGRGRDRDWNGFGVSGRRGDLPSRDQTLAKSFNQSSTSLGNPDGGWGTRSGENHQTIGTSPTRGYRQEVRLDGPSCLLLRADCKGSSLLNQPAARTFLFQYIKPNPQWGPRYITLRCSLPLFNHSHHRSPCGQCCGHCTLN
jgi:hypothetical protein